MFHTQKIIINVCLFQYIYQIFVNGRNVDTVVNTKAEKFGPMKVFAGDNFYKAPEGEMKNLYIHTSVE